MPARPRYPRAAASQPGSPRDSISARAAAVGSGLALLPAGHPSGPPSGKGGFSASVNPVLVVTTIPITDDGRVVLLGRGIEPGKGWWAQPGGFLEVDETVTECAVRETFEETGLIVKPGEIIGLYARLEAAVVVLVFEAQVVSGEFRTNPEALEIEAFEPEAIPRSRIAFSTTMWALRDWVARRRPDLAHEQPVSWSNQRGG